MLAKMSQEEFDRRTRYSKVDLKVSELLGEDDYEFYLSNTHKAAIEWKDGCIKRLQEDVASRDLSIKVLQRENGLIWERYMTDVAAEKMKVREMESRYRAVLEGR
jgi:hypothetical protein